MRRRTQPRRRPPCLCPTSWSLAPPRPAPRPCTPRWPRHPALYMSPVKEPKFFLTDGPPPAKGGGPGDVPTWREHVWRRADYEALFARGHGGPAARRVHPVLPVRPGRAAADPGADPGRQDDRHPARPGRAGALQLGPPVVGRAGPGGRLRRRPAPRRTAGSPRAGRTSGTTPGWAGTASSSSTCTGCSRGTRSWCSATGSWWTRRPQTLDEICALPGRAAGRRHRGAQGERDRASGRVARATG